MANTIPKEGMLINKVRTKESYEELAAWKLLKASVFDACLVGVVPVGNRPKPRYEDSNK